MEGASVISPQSQSLSNATIAGMEDECLEKIENDQDTLEDVFKLKFTFVRVFNKISQSIKHRNSLESIDKAIDDICYPAVADDNLYALTMRIVKLCLNQEASFNHEEKDMIKVKLERIFCSVYMKIGNLYLNFFQVFLSKKILKKGLHKYFLHCFLCVYSSVWEGLFWVQRKRKLYLKFLGQFKKKLCSE